MNDMHDAEMAQHGLTPDGERLVDWAACESAARGLTRRTGDIHLPADRGEHSYPRFFVVRAPKVGDEVSYSFNGDSYPCGKVVKTSASRRVVYTYDAANGRAETFYRRKLTGTWLRTGGTWALVQGHVDERNRSF